MYDNYLHGRISTSDCICTDGVIISDNGRAYVSAGVISTIADTTTIASTPKQEPKKGKRLLTRYEKLDPKNIKKVVFNNPATIIIFTDDTKVVAKVHNEEFDEEKGFLMAMSRILFETRAEMNKIIDKGIEDSYK